MCICVAGSSWVQHHYIALNILLSLVITINILIREGQGCATCCSLAAGLRENGERMRKWTENEEMDRELGKGQRIRKGTENGEMDR